MGTYPSLQIQAATEAKAAGTCAVASRGWVLAGTVPKAQHVGPGHTGRDCYHHGTHQLLHPLLLSPGLVSLSPGLGLQVDSPVTPVWLLISSKSGAAAAPAELMPLGEEVP